MFQIEKAFWKLLQNNIYYNDELVPLVRNLDQRDRTPCITLTLADETQLKREYIENMEEHKQYQRKKFNCEIWINIWCNTESERTGIVEGVENRIFQAEANHYTTCYNFNPDTEECSNIEETCKALTVTNGRTSKGQCPDVEKYSYCSFFKNNHIIKNTFYINSKMDNDELDLKPPLLREILKYRFEYWKYRLIGGVLFEDMEINPEIEE